MRALDGLGSDALGDAARSRLIGVAPSSQKVRLAEELISRTREASSTAGVAENVAVRWGEDALDWLDELHHAGNPFYVYGAGGSQTIELRAKVGDKDCMVSNPNDWIWVPRSLRSGMLIGPSSASYWPLDRVELQGLAARHLRSPWIGTPRVELLLIQMLVYAETLLYSDSQEVLGPIAFMLRGTSPSTRAVIGTAAALLKVAFRLGVPVALALYVGDDAATRYGAWSGILAGSVVGWIWWQLMAPVSGDTAELRKRLEHMLGVHLVLSQDPVCPSLVRERLLTAANSGALWPDGTFALAEAAVRRDPVIWC